MHFILVPLCQDDMELTIYLVGGHSLKNILLGFNLEGQPQKEGGGGCTLVSNMAAHERYVIQGEDSLYGWCRLSCVGSCGSLVLQAMRIERVNCDRSLTVGRSPFFR